MEDMADLADPQLADPRLTATRISIKENRLDRLRTFTKRELRDFNKWEESQTVFTQMKERLPSDIKDDVIRTACHFMSNSLKNSSESFLKDPNYRPRRKNHHKADSTPNTESPGATGEGTGDNTDQRTDSPVDTDLTALKSSEDFQGNMTHSLPSSLENQPQQESKYAHCTAYWGAAMRGRMQGKWPGAVCATDGTTKTAWVILRLLSLNTIGTGGFALPAEELQSKSPCQTRPTACGCYTSSRYEC